MSGPHVKDFDPHWRIRFFHILQEVRPVCKTRNHFDLSGAGAGPPRRFGDCIIDPPPGRHWAFGQEGIDELRQAGRIIFSGGGRPRLRTNVEDLPGVAVRDVWTDIEPINAAAADRLGYQTQKPEALLDRIILMPTAAVAPR